MRQQRERVFQITVSGRDTWRESAGNRTVEEVQDKLASELGVSVHVREQYLGVAKRKLVEVEEEEEE